MHARVIFRCVSAHASCHPSPHPLFRVGSTLPIVLSEKTEPKLSSTVLSGMDTLVCYGKAVWCSIFPFALYRSWVLSVRSALGLWDVWGGACIPVLQRIFEGVSASLALDRWYIRKLQNHSGLSRSHSLSGNKWGNKTKKRGGHGQNWAGNPQSSRVNLFYANIEFAHKHSIQDCDGQECAWLSHVKIYQNVKTTTHQNKQGVGICNLLCFYLIRLKGGCLHGEDMDVTHR